MSAIQTHNLSKMYKNGIHALQNVSLEVTDGDFFALLGANGAGKTTLIGILTGLVNKSDGKAKIFGIDIDKNHDAAKLLIGLVPQEFNFNIFEKVLDIVCQQAGYFGISRSEAESRAEPILKQLDLWDRRETQSMQLSGGMKRRMMIARALINHPKLLILDEPTAGVDVELRHSTWDYVQELNKKGTTILLTTHYIEEAEQLCKNVAIIKEGEIVKKGNIKTLLSQIDTRKYILTVNKLGNFKLTDYELTPVDENTVEVDLGIHQSVHELFEVLKENGVTILDIKPKGNRLEELFLSILKK